MTIKRAADLHEVMAVIGKPKPTRQPKAKRQPVAKRRRVLEKQLEDIVKLIIAWRDGQVCVMGQMDGARCGNGLMWNHFIAQGQSGWMRIDLGNVYWGCGSHNLLERFGDPILGMWVQDTFGIAAVKALREEAKAHTTKNKTGKRTEQELEELLARYDELYQNRFYVNLDLDSLIEAGYYGEIIKAAARSPRS